MGERGNENKKTNDKYCVVPGCTSTTVKNPDKIFISLPKDKKQRLQWQKAMRRTHYLSEKSHKHCCEDHFNLEQDLENYRYFITMKNVPARLFPGVVPHIFRCQENRSVNKSCRSRTAVLKRKQAESVNEVLNPKRSCLQENLSQNDEGEVNRDHKDIIQEQISNIQLKKQKSVQVDIKPRTKTLATQCDIDYLTGTVSSSNNSLISSPSVNNTLTDSSLSGVEIWNSRDNLEKRQIYIIERNPSIYLGIPNDSFFVINNIEKKCKVARLNIFITLKKIRLNLPYSVLADDFCLSKIKICKIVQKTVPLLATFFKFYIAWKPLKDIQNNLPVPFRPRYKTVQCILDCLEISIEKPGNPVLQASSWSEYKQANTMKYLISYTPDGLISYISTGFDGRTTDKMIVEECGILTLLDKESSVMANHGLKDIENLLIEQGNMLVRPPPESSKKNKCSKEEVKQAKRISSLRIHVESVIQKVRGFALLKPHAEVDHSLIKCLDSIIVIACGIINIQNDNILL